MTAPNIILLGFMGAGKSTIGRMLAERLGWTFVDTDQLVVAQAGQPISAIFAQEGEAGFRARERQAVERACAGTGQVIAAGGGAILDPENVRVMQRSGCVLVLGADPEALWQRASGSSRPLAADREGFMRRYHERMSLYSALGPAIATDQGPPPVAVEAILARLQGEGVQVPVQLADRSYRINIEPGGLWHLGDRMAEVLKPGTCMVVTNPTVEALYAARVLHALERAGWSPGLITVPDGEGAKSLQQAERLYDHALSIHLERRQPIVALGGGVVGDLAGFVAATYQRGVPFVQVPTTLLAQIDSSVGGKVAVNHPRGKNLIGAFHQPALVVADPLTLQSLSEREWRAGLAELVKYGVILDAPFFSRLEAEWPLIRQRSLKAVLPAIQRACELKAHVVAEDEREGGHRAILNFGHTVGHAIEAVTGYGTFLHGEAVAIGMVAAGEIALSLGTCPDEDLERLRSWLAAAGLPTRLEGLSSAALLEAMRLDKKVQDGRLHFVLPEAIGRGVIRSDVPERVVSEALGRLGAS